MQNSVLGDTLFAPHRERVLYTVALVAGAMFAPLAIHHFLEGDRAIALVLGCVVAMLAIDTFAMQLGSRPPIPFPLLLVPGALAVAMSLLSHGVYGALWAYPMTLFAYFVLQRRQANVIAAAFAAMVAGIVLVELGAGLALRFGLSLGLCIVVVNIILGVMERMQAQLLSHAITDPLTGAFNRRHMDTCLREAIERHGRTGSPASLILVDIDHFKSLNDRLGHAAGDEVLKAVVDRIRVHCRKADRLFRLGGEEFLLLLPETVPLEATAIAENLRRGIATARILDGRSVTASVGVSQARAGDAVDDWLRRVDFALYEAKKAGRDCVLATNTHLARSSLSSSPRA